MHIRSIRQIKNLSNKTVFLRVDFNVPLEDGLIKDDYKIIATLPTIKFLLQHKCSLIIATHLTQPLDNKFTLSTTLVMGDEKKASVRPIAERLSKLLDKKVNFINDCCGKLVIEAVAKLKPGEILFLENLRFQNKEQENNEKFAKQLADLADIYVNDAFAVCHRYHASVSAIKKYLPAYAGLLLEKEITNLNKIIKPTKPLISIIGGVKIKTKIVLIKKLLKKSYYLLIGGALANNFIAAHGFEVGCSITDQASIKIATELKNNKKIIIPTDVIVSNKKNNGKVVVKNIDQINKKDIILDIGPKTIKLYANFIKLAKTLIWNGPMGYFENEHFKQGTLAIAKLVASQSTGKTFGVVGGGETLEALKMTKMINNVDWVSTGGGAMLTYLSGVKMPGLKGII
ncbi:MAG: phosphoglycerate kinase [Patescibacteria group bacterium]|nr:phosphoglycerate kinase [Patescibacteria group bacterium]MBU1870729.1 phosphoglycerate kinase [Patescibacteria group bacterium]